MVVGANGGWSSDRPLRYAEEDARRVADVLVELGGVAKDDVRLLLEPTVDQLSQALGEAEGVLRKTAEPTVLYFFYSGHADSQSLHLRGPEQHLATLVDRLTKTGASLTVAVFDSCMSGAVLATKGARPVTPFRIHVEEPVQGLALISSSDADELSQESKALAGSVFTHHWVSGLRGAADVDGDRTVSLAEGYTYAYERTRSDTGSSTLPQRPGFRFDLKGQGDVWLTQLERGSAAFDFSKARGQRYIVVDVAEQRLIAETTSVTPKQRLEVPPGTYKLKRPVAEGIEVAQVTLADKSFVDATSLTFTLQPRELGFVKGGSQFSDWAATGSLAHGDAEAALVLFDHALAESPEDVAARRGKARALLVRSLDAQRQGKAANELRDVEQALALDPGLSTDPSFERFAQRAQQLRGEEERARTIRKSTEKEIAQNPRIRRHWGLGFGLVSTKGILTFEAYWMPKSYLSVGLSIDLVGPGIDASVRWIPLGWQWSPYVGLGAHYGFGFFQTTGGFLVNGKAVEQGYGDIWGKMFHADLGMQWISHGGFVVEFGGGPMLYAFKGTWQWFGFANLAFGFYF